MQIYTPIYTLSEQELYETTKWTEAFENNFNLQAPGRLLGFTQLYEPPHIYL